MAKKIGIIALLSLLVYGSVFAIQDKPENAVPILVIAAACVFGIIRQIKSMIPKKMMSVKKFLVISLKVLATVALAFLMLACLSAMMKSAIEGAVFFLVMTASCAFGIVMLYVPKTNKQKGNPSAAKNQPPAAAVLPQSAANPVVSPQPATVTQAAPVPPKDAPAAEKPVQRHYNSFRFRVANTNTQNRQEYLRKIDSLDEPFGYCTFDFAYPDPDEAQKIKVIVTDEKDKERVLGYAPKELVAYIDQLASTESFVVDVEVVESDDGDRYEAICKVEYFTILDSDTAYNEIGFKIVGVTFQGRQAYLEKIAQLDNRFVACTFSVREFVYDNKPAFEVVATLISGEEYNIGNVPADRVEQVLEIKDRIENVELSVHGGDDGKNYGAYCKITYKE